MLYKKNSHPGVTHVPTCVNYLAAEKQMSTEIVNFDSDNRNNSALLKELDLQFHVYYLYYLEHDFYYFLIFYILLFFFQ